MSDFMDRAYPYSPDIMDGEEEPSFGEALMGGILLGDSATRKDAFTALFGAVLAGVLAAKYPEVIPDIGSEFVRYAMIADCISPRSERAITVGKYLGEYWLNPGSDWGAEFGDWRIAGVSENAAKEALRARIAEQVEMDSPGSAIVWRESRVSGWPFAKLVKGMTSSLRERLD